VPITSPSLWRFPPPMAFTHHKRKVNIIMNLMKCRSQGIWVWFLHLLLNSGKEFTFVMCHSHMLIMPLVVPMKIITIHTNEHGVYKLFTWHAHMAPLFMLLHYEKKGCFIIDLKLNFWIASDICNSLYLHAISANGQVAWVVELQLTICMVQIITIQLQLCQNNSFSITMQLHYNYTHDVMLTSLIVIHLSKFNMWCQGHKNPQKQRLK